MVWTSQGDNMLAIEVGVSDAAEEDVATRIITQMESIKGRARGKDRGGEVVLETVDRTISGMAHRCIEGRTAQEFILILLQGVVVKPFYSIPV